MNPVIAVGILVVLLIVGMIAGPRIPWSKLFQRGASTDQVPPENHRQQVYIHFDGLFRCAGPLEQEALLTLLPPILKHCEEHHVRQVN